MIDLIVYDGGASVTQSDTTADAAGPFAGLMVQVAGLVKLTTVRGYTITVSAAVGIVVPIAVQRVWSGTTTATGITGLYAPPFKGPGVTQ
jgi:hypothetical protein